MQTNDQRQLINNIKDGLKKNQGEKPNTVLVLGGYGFIGRYTVAALNKAGINTVIGTRGLDAKKNERHVRLHKSLTEESWTNTLKDIDSVINTVGILRERKGESFDAVHNLALGALARACKQHNIPLIHVSALGIDAPLNNEFAASKLRGESAMQNSACPGAIVRASVVNAPDGYGSGWLHTVAKWPIWLLPSGATKLLCPIEAKDLGQALAMLCIKAINDPNKNKGCEKAQIIEVGCNEVFTLKTYLHKLRTISDCRLKKPLLTVRIPRVVARAFSHIFDVLNLTPYSIGHHELLEHDNIPKKIALQKFLVVNH